MWQRITESPIIDVLDILIVAFLLYRLLAFIRDTRAVQMFVGLGFLLVLSFVASSLGMAPSAGKQPRRAAATRHRLRGKSSKAFAQGHPPCGRQLQDGPI